MAQRRTLHDEFFKRAKAEGYLARSAYKLLEIQERTRLLRPGDRVLDLGCAPGSWLQVAARAVGPRGFVVGVDLHEVGAPIAPHVRTIVADVFALDPAALPRPDGAAEAPPFDAVLSDMAPDTSGHGDDFLSVRLCRRVLELIPRVLRPGGSLVMKVLEGEEFPALLRETRARFAGCGPTKPRASRDASREIYIVARGYRGGSRPVGGP